MMDFHETKGKLLLMYVVMGLRVATLWFLCFYMVFMVMVYLFHAKNLTNSKNGKNYCKKSVFAIKKVFIHENFKIATLRPITT